MCYRNTFLLGHTAVGERLVIEVLVRQNRFAQAELSISGLLYAYRGRNAIAAGQIRDEVLRVTRFAPGMNARIARQIYGIWNAWHLNDMNAGCKHQRSHSWKGANANGQHGRYPDHIVPAPSRFWGEPLIGPGIMDATCKPCHYTYGTAWLRRELPTNVIDTVKSWGRN